MKKIVNRINKNKKFVALLLGMLTVAALPPFFQFYVLSIALTGLFYLTEKSETSFKAFGVGYWFGFGYFSLGFSWIGNALLIDASTMWLYPIAIISAGLFFGLFIAFPTYLASKFRGTYVKFFALSFLLVIFEWIRSFIFTGFPWNQFGSTLAFDIRLLQTAAIWGTYGLSLIVIMTYSSSVLYIVDRDAKSGITSFAIPLIITLGIYTYGNKRTIDNTFFENSDIKIRIVQPNISQKLKWDSKSLSDNFKEYIDLSQYPGADDLDFVIWGETASPYSLDIDPQHLNMIKDAVPNLGYLVTGSIRYEYNFEDRRYQPANSLFVINKQGGIEESYDKSHLVPFGEYIPLKEHLPEWIRPLTNVVGEFVKGTGNKTIKLDGYPSLGPLICYEIIFPSEVINKDDKPQWLINVTNDGWYGDSMGPYQHLVTTQLRAIEEGITIARAANTGISAVISYTGKVLDKLPLNKSGNLDVFLPKDMSTRTIYGKFGNFLIYILVFSYISMLFLFRKRKK